VSRRLCGPTIEDAHMLGGQILVSPMFWSIRAAPLRGRGSIELVRTLWFMRYGLSVRRAITNSVADIVHSMMGHVSRRRDRRRSGVPVVMHARTVADRDHWRYSGQATPEEVCRTRRCDPTRAFGCHTRLVPCEVIYNPLDTTTRGSRDDAHLHWGLSPQCGYRFWRICSLTRVCGISLDCGEDSRRRRDIVFQIAGGTAGA